MQNLFSVDHYALSVYSFPLFFVGVLVALLGVTVFFREGRSPVSLSFSLLTSFVAFWLLAFGLVNLAADARTALAWTRAANGAVVFIPTFFFIFTLAAANMLRRHQIAALLALGVSAVFEVLVWATPWFIYGVRKYFWGYYPLYSKATWPFMFFFFSLMLLCFGVLWNAYKKSVPRSKRLKNFMMGFGIAYLASIDFFAAYGVNIYPCGYLPVLVFAVYMTWGIWRFRLVDITPSFAADQILKTMADGLLVFDRQGIVRVANKAASLLFSEDGADLTGRRLDCEGLDFFRKENLARLLWTGSVQTHELVFFNKKTGMHMLDVSTSVIRDSNKEPLAVVCIVKDATYRRNAETALRESENHYRILAENIQDVIWTMDLDMKLTYISPSVTKLRGYTVAEAMTQSLEKTFTATSSKSAMVSLSGICQSHDSHAVYAPLELEYIRKDGTGVWAEVQITVLRDSEGRARELLGVSRNISEHRRVRETLKTAEICYFDLIAAVSDPIMIFERSGTLKMMNRAAEQVLGYIGPQLLGKTFQKMEVLAPESTAKTLQEMTLVWLGWQRACFDICFIRKDGTRVMMEAVPCLVRKNTDQPLAQILFRNVREASSLNKESAA